MFKRIVLFLITNLAVLFVLGIVLNLLGLNRIPIGAGGEIDYATLLGFSAVMGFGGSLISLAMSKFIAKMSTGAKVITTPQTTEERWLLDTVRTLADKAGIGMPEVALYDSPDVNAFATGARRNNALVAVSTGLLRSMQQDEVEAVLGHEISHVANGDMVTLTLIQGVLNTFVIFLSRVIGYAVDAATSKEGERRRGPGIGSFAVMMIAQLVLGILASMIVAWFSRKREYRADAGSAKLHGAPSMISALEALKRIHQPSALPKALNAFGIHGGGVMNLFATHPPIEARIAALTTSHNNGT